MPPFLTCQTSLQTIPSITASITAMQKQWISRPTNLYQHSVSSVVQTVKTRYLQHFLGASRDTTSSIAWTKNSSSKFIKSKKNIQEHPFEHKILQKANLKSKPAQTSSKKRTPKIKLRLKVQSPAPTLPKPSNQMPKNPIKSLHPLTPSPTYKKAPTSMPTLTTTIPLSSIPWPPTRPPRMSPPLAVVNLILTSSSEIGVDVMALATHPTATSHGHCWLGSRGRFLGGWDGSVWWFGWC